MSDKRRNSSGKKNTFILKKLENENQLREEIKRSFDDPTKYLSVNPNLIIGIIKLNFHLTLFIQLHLSSIFLKN